MTFSKTAHDIITAGLFAWEEQNRRREIDIWDILTKIASKR